MKRLLLLTFATAMFIGLPLSADEPDIFSYDKNHVEAVMTDLDQLENYVFQNKGTSLTNMELNGTFENTNLVRVSPLNETGLYGELPLGIPSFWWGCVLGVAGLAIVYFIAEDAEETKKALYGCIAGTVFWIAVNVVIYLAYGSAWWSY